jgi:uncharacterized protein (TIGR00290 family)
LTAAADRAPRATVALGWSGGKDSALALLELRASGTEPVALLTTVTEGFERVSMHGVRRELLQRQSAAIGIPLVEVDIPPACVNELYDRRMADAVAGLARLGVDTMAFGDIFLEDVRAYREERLARTGMTGTFPLWGRNTSELADRFLAAGFEAVLSCVDTARLDPALAGRRYDRELLTELPEGVDPCGENGEFHTFVAAGPIMAGRVGYGLGGVVLRDGFAFRDLLPS